jgi:sugar/nucleoside kinase (ribokinase family)
LVKRFDVAVMHDYFVDRLIHTRKLKTTIQQIRNKALSGGGGLHGYIQEEIRGGNSVNLANALAKLGLRTLLITHSERIHEHLLRESFRGLRAEVRVKPLPAGLTVAIEEKVNVMLAYGRGAADFGPSELDEDDWGGLENSRIVCSVNWAANKRGTDLLLALRKRLGEEKTIFIDPADFRDRVEHFKELMHLIARRRLVNWVSMNEYESLAAARALRLRATDRGTRCIELARDLRVVFDMHCVDGSFSSDGTRVTSVSNRVLRSRRLTGAGDVWDAAAIYGRLKGMDEVQRLSFANKAAKLYLESVDPVPPSLAQLQ